MRSILPIEQELQKLREQVAQLEAENAELKLNQKEPEPLDDWYDSGCYVNDYDWANSGC